MKIKAIIFDMDGTIIDTNHIWNDITDSLIAHLAIKMPLEVRQEIAKKTHGLAMTETCQLIKDATNRKESIEDIIIIKKKIAADLLSKGMKFIEGFEDFHKTVVKFNLKNAIATNADPGTLRIAKETLNLYSYFQDNIYDIALVNNKCKPDPAIYLHAMDNLGVKPNECIAIEDSAHGIRAAQNAGIFCVGINTSKDEKQVSLADHIIEGYSELNLQSIVKKI